MDYANYWREQALKVLQQPPANTPAPASNAKAAPKLSDFPAGDGQFDAVKWADAHGAWAQEQIAAQVAASLANVDQQRSAQSVQQSYNTKLAAFKATVPDFDIVSKNPSLPVTKDMTEAMLADDLGPQVYYHLCKNPPEAARISRLPAHQQAAAIGKISGRLEVAAQKPNTPAPRQRTQAPPPPSGVRNNGSGDINLETCTVDEYMTHRLQARKNR